MGRRGFTLTEVLIVIALIGILSGIATYGFNQHTTKSRVENQTRQLYGDLMEYRAKSLYEKRNWTFKFSAASYGIYSSADTSVAPVTSNTFKYPVTFNVTEISFNTMGITNDSGTVCVTANNSAAVDSIVIAKTRVQIGKRRGVLACAADNIDAK